MATAVVYVILSLFPFVYIVHKDAGMLVHDGFERTDTLAAQAARYQINHGIHAPVRFIPRNTQTI